MEKCKICENYLMGKEECKFCQFEYAKDLPWTNDDKWDILNLDDDIEWSHLQILYRLNAKGVDCLKADIWTDNNMAYLFLADTNPDKIADALGIHKEVVYNQDFEGLVIINLFQEKYLRGMLDKRGQ